MGRLRFLGWILSWFLRLRRDLRWIRALRVERNSVHPWQDGFPVLASDLALRCQILVLGNSCPRTLEKAACNGIDPAVGSRLRRRVCHHSSCRWHSFGCGRIGMDDGAYDLLDAVGGGGVGRTD